MLQMTLPMGLYRRWEASRDLWRHICLATKWESIEASREGYRYPHISTLGYESIRIVRGVLESSKVILYIPLYID